MISIQNEELFKQSLSKGINLLTGAGFSVLAKNRTEESLPLVPGLVGKICSEYDLKKYSNRGLSWLSKQIKRNKAQEYNLFLKSLYSVENYDQRYECLSKINIKNILTTNIDNLAEKIFDNIDRQYLNDTKLHGVLDSSEINLYKLHGSVTYSYKEEMLFSTDELSGAFLRDNSFWSAAQIKHHSFPTLFWGINVNDPNIIDLINKKNFGGRPSANNWILILPEKDFDIDAETYQEDGYFIIRGKTDELLNYICEIDLEEREGKSEKIYTTSHYFEEHQIDNILTKKHPARPIRLFYQGDDPRWSDIIEEKLYRLSFFNEIKNDILSKNHVHITGIHGSGKTTLLMQLAASKEIPGNKFYFEHITTDQAKKFISEFSNKENIIIFLDNLSANLDAFDLLKEMVNVKIISAERDIVSFNIRVLECSSKNTSVIDISDISSGEIKQICHHMNKPPQTFRYEKTSLFEIVSKLWFNTEAQKRIKQVVNNLPEGLLEFYTINAYARFSGIACSMDMLFSYYMDDEDIGYKEIFQYVDQLRSAIDEDNYYKDEAQDYFTLRSKIFSEMSIKVIKPAVLGHVISKFHRNIHQSLIHNFKIFRRKAWDADITILAFPNKEKGIQFYEEQLKNYDDPFIKHQYSLYLYRNNLIDNAWRIIEEASNDTNGRVFSINNTHAMFLFERNIDREEDEHGTVDEMLRKSFDELEKCLLKDASKSFHAITYAKHAKRYHKRYSNDNSISFLLKSIKFVNQELSNNKYKPYKVFMMLKNLQEELPAIKIS